MVEIKILNLDYKVDNKFKGLIQLYGCYVPDPDTSSRGYNLKAKSVPVSWGKYTSVSEISVKIPEDYVGIIGTNYQIGDSPYYTDEAFLCFGFVQIDLLADSMANNKDNRELDNGDEVRFSLGFDTYGMGCTWNVFFDDDDFNDEIKKRLEPALKRATEVEAERNKEENARKTMSLSNKEKLLARRKGKPAPKPAEELSDEDWFNKFDPEKRAEMLKKLRSMGESRRYRGRALRESRLRRLRHR